MRRFLPWAALAAGVAGATTVLVWTAVGAGDGQPIEPVGGVPVSAVTSVAPRAHFVGDRVVATLDLTVDPALTDPARIDVVTGFRPYTRVAPVEVERRDADGATRIRYTYALQCIDRACVDRVSGERYAFGAATIRYSSSSVGQGTILADWPELTVASRLAPGDLAAREFRADADTPPPLDTAVSPTLLAWLLAGAAALLALAAAAVTALWLRRRSPRTAPTVAATADATQLDRALARVGAAIDGEEPERRAALDELARALERDGRPELAPVARRLAWSRAAPEDEEMRELAGAAGGEP